MQEQGGSAHGEAARRAEQTGGVPTDPSHRAGDSPANAPGQGGVDSEQAESDHPDPTTARSKDRAVDDADDELDEVDRDKPWGLIAVVAGLIALVAVVAICQARFTASEDFVAAVAPATGGIVGLVGTYFGIRATSLVNKQPRSRGPRKKKRGDGGRGRGGLDDSRERRVPERGGS